LISNSYRTLDRISLIRQWIGSMIISIGCNRSVNRRVVDDLQMDHFVRQKVSIKYNLSSIKQLITVTKSNDDCLSCNVQFNGTRPNSIDFYAHIDEFLSDNPSLHCTKGYRLRKIYPYLI
jgi:hypothetical protein